MKAWLVTVGEPLPTDAGDRLLRTGIMAELMAGQGTDVLWWTADFDHYHKRARHGHDVHLRLGERLHIQLLHAPRYKKNISLQRILNHRGVAKRFRHLSRTLPHPDVILCSLPTLELCLEATAYGREFHVPVVLDVRDLWPDVFLDLVPQVAQPLAKHLFTLAYRKARIACSQATAITGVTPEYVDWGVTNALRTRHDLDRHFPMGYVDSKPDIVKIRNAEKFWSGHGIKKDDESFVACWFGVFNRYSEIDAVIEAARSLARFGKSVQFVLCGTGSDLERCRRQAQDCSSIFMPGWVNAAQIWTLLRMSSVGLAPYVSSDNFRRNLPNKPVEYLSAGLPIVSSLQGVLARLLEDHGCGITYQNGRADELARTIVALMDDPARRNRMAGNAVSLYRSQFVAENVYSDMHNYLKEIAGLGSTTRAGLQVA